MYIVNAKYNMEFTALHYIYCKVYVVFVSEFSLVAYADLLNLWYVKNLFENPCTRTFHEMYYIYFIYNVNPL